MTVTEVIVFTTFFNVGENFVGFGYGLVLFVCKKMLCKNILIEQHCNKYKSKNIQEQEDKREINVPQTSP